MRIYAACLASYNAGILHGQWIDVDGGVDAIKEEIDEMLKASPVPGAEEYAIHDYEGFPDAAVTAFGEWPDFEEVFAVAESLTDSGEVFEAALEYLGNIKDALNCIERGDYIACGDSEEDVVREYLHDTGLLDSIPEELRRYFDYKHYARDLRGEWFFQRVNGTVYAFRS